MHIDVILWSHIQRGNPQRNKVILLLFITHVFLCVSGICMQGVEVRPCSGFRPAGCLKFWRRSDPVIRRPNCVPHDAALEYPSTSRCVNRIFSRFWHKLGWDGLLVMFQSWCWLASVDFNCWQEIIVYIENLSEHRGCRPLSISSTFPLFVCGCCFMWILLWCAGLCQLKYDSNLQWEFWTKQESNLACVYVCFCVTAYIQK